jgi:RNA polymerase sigma-70 factor (ECF subfamily)
MAAARSEPDAFVEVFDRHFDTVCRYLTRRVGPDAGEELAAETFARAFDARRTYEPRRGDVRAWLFGIAVNLLRHHYRTETRQLRAYARSGVDPVVEPEGETEDRLDADSLGPRVAAALAALSPRDREVLLLYAWAELGYEEIAAALDVPVGTIRSRLSRSRARVVRLLANGGQPARTELTSNRSPGWISST